MTGTTDSEWSEETAFEAWEVNRVGDNVYFSLSNREGALAKYEFSVDDAVSIGIALAQAGQESDE